RLPMTDIDAEPGLDRRALIKKGLVAGGIVATAPVISTFHTAAFASSPPGCNRVQFEVSTSGSTISVAPEAVTDGGSCEPVTGPPTNCTWDDIVVPTNPAPTISTSVNQTTDTVTFTLTGAFASCEFVGGSALRTTGGGPDPCQNPLTGVTFGTNTITWAVPNNQNWEVRLLIFC
ncbi:MAG TPA: hypothetical protein VJ804_06670, partial [Acidimicrobiales bacterium]|nr:hypothetical protein [Acidimicrobiales bacterium]